MARDMALPHLSYNPDSHEFRKQPPCPQRQDPPSLGAGALTLSKPTWEPTPYQPSETMLPRLPLPPGS